MNRGPGSADSESESLRFEEGPRFCSVLLKREKLNEITSSEMWHSEKTLNYTHANHSFREVYTSSKTGPTGGVTPGEL